MTTLRERAAAIVLLHKNCAFAGKENSDMVCSIASLCPPCASLIDAIEREAKAFAELALREAIVIERPYIDRSDLAVRVPGEPYEKRKPFLSVPRFDERSALDKIITAAIAAAEKGEP